MKEIKFLKNNMEFLYKILKRFFALLIKLINNLMSYFGKKNFLQSLHDHIEQVTYVKKKINNKNILFFVPNKRCLGRVENLFDSEPETIDWINNFNSKKKIIFWDIGANIGLYSIYATSIHENIEVVSFEPSTSNLRSLSRNISINNLYDKIKIIQLALTNKPNVILDMKETKFSEGGSISTFGENFDNDGNPIYSIKNQYKIFGTSINYLLEEKILEIPNYIKIDVDGLEHLILKGANKFLKSEELMEISIELNSRFEDQYKNAYEILEKNNFILKKNDFILKKNTTQNHYFIRR